MKVFRNLGWKHFLGLIVLITITIVVGYRLLPDDPRLVYFYQKVTELVPAKKPVEIPLSALTNFDWDKVCFKVFSGISAPHVELYFYANDVEVAEFTLKPGKYYIGLNYMEDSPADNCYLPESRMTLKRIRPHPDYKGPRIQFFDKHQEFIRQSMPMPKAEYASLLGEVPKDLIKVGPLSKDEGIWEAHLAFDSDDIAGYSGRPFKVNVHLKLYTIEREKNDMANYYLKKIYRGRRQEQYRELPVRQILIGDEGDPIGKNVLAITTFENVSPNKKVQKMIQDREYLLINNTDAAIYYLSIWPKKKWVHLSGVARYNTSIRKKCEAVYFITSQPHDELGHTKFIYAKQFVERFYVQ